MPIAPFQRRRRYPLSAEADTDTYAATFVRADTERLTIADNASIRTGDIDYSFAFWYYSTTLPPGGKYHFIISKDEANKREFLLYVSRTTLQFEFVAMRPPSTIVGTAVASTHGAISNATWYFVYCYHSATSNEVGISVDDGVVDTAATSGAAGSGTANFAIGGAYTSYCDMYIAYTGYWKGLPSAANLSALYASGPTLKYGDLTAGQKANLESWWDCEKESGDRVDSHGSNDLTDINTVGRTLVVYP